MRRMVPDERRALILEAAGGLFSERPYAGVSVADIAQAANVSPPLIMFHFGSKRALYLAVIQVAVDAIREGLQSVPGPPSLSHLRKSVRFYAGYARDHRPGFLSLVRGRQEAALPEVAEIVEALRAEVAEQLLTDLTALGHPAAQPTGAGAGPSGHPALMTAIHGYLGYIDAAIVHWLSLPDAESSQVSEYVIARLAAGAFTGSLAEVPGPQPAAQAGTGGPA